MLFRSLPSSNILSWLMGKSSPDTFPCFHQVSASLLVTSSLPWALSQDVDFDIISCVGEHTY